MTLSAQKVMTAGPGRRHDLGPGSLLDVTPAMACDRATGTRRLIAEVIEAALAHVKKNKTEAACARSDWFDKGGGNY